MKEDIIAESLTPILPGLPMETCENIITVYSLLCKHEAILIITLSAVTDVMNNPRHSI